MCVYVCKCENSIPLRNSETEILSLQWLHHNFDYEREKKQQISIW